MGQQNAAYSIPNEAEGTESSERIRKLAEEGMYSHEELARLLKGEITEFDLKLEAQQSKKEAERIFEEIEMNIVGADKIRFNSESRMLRQEIAEETSPEKLKELLKNLKELQEKETQKLGSNLNTQERLDINHPKIQEYIQSVKEYLEDPEKIKWIGSKQIKQFETWYEDQLKNSPTIATAMKIKSSLLNHDRDGIPPRREFYEKTLAPKLKKYGLSLENCPFLEQEGLKERKEGIETINKLEKSLDRSISNHLCTRATKTQIIQKALQSSSMEEIQNMYTTAEAVNKEEKNKLSSSSIFRKATITVQGLTFQAMSEKSIKLFMKGYMDYDLETRKDTLPYLENIAKNEGKLIQELGTIYKDDPVKFKQVAAKFAKLSYQEKQSELNSHREYIENQKDQEKNETERIEADITREIDNAVSDKVISKKTAEGFKKTAKNKNNFKDPKTGRFSVKLYQQFYEQLTAENPVYQKDRRNLKAYEVQKENFSQTLDKFQQEDPSFSAEKQKKYQDAFDEGTYHKREILFAELRGEKREAEKNRNKVFKEISGNIKTALKYTKVEIDKEDWHDQSEAFHRDMDERINLNLNGIEPIYIQAYLEKNQTKIDDQIDKLYEKWLKQHEAMHEKEEEKKQEKTEKEEELKNERQEKETELRVSQKVETAIHYETSEIENESWHDQPKNFQDDIWQRINDSTTGLDEEVIEKYLAKNKRKIDNKVKKLYEQWLAEHETMHEKEEQQKKQEKILAREKARAEKEIVATINNAISYTDEEIENESWHDQPQNFQNDIWDKISTDLAELDNDHIQIYLEKNSIQINDQIGELYKNWLQQHEETHKKEEIEQNKQIKEEKGKQKENNKEISTIVEKSLQYEKAEIENENWHDKPQNFKQDFWDKISENLKGLDETTVKNYLKSNHPKINQDLEKLYDQWLAEHEAIHEHEEEENEENQASTKEKEKPPEKTLHPTIANLLGKTFTENYLSQFDEEQIAQGQDRMLTLLENSNFKNLLQSAPQHQTNFFLATVSIMEQAPFDKFIQQLENTTLSPEEILSLVFHNKSISENKTLKSQFKESWKVVSNILKTNEKERVQQEETEAEIAEQEELEKQEAEKLEQEELEKQEQEEKEQKEIVEVKTQRQAEEKRQEEIAAAEIVFQLDQKLEQMEQEKLAQQEAEEKAESEKQQEENKEESEKPENYRLTKEIKESQRKTEQMYQYRQQQTLDSRFRKIPLEETDQSNQLNLAELKKLEINHGDFEERNKNKNILLKKVENTKPESNELEEQTFNKDLNKKTPFKIINKEEDQNKNGLDFELDDVELEEEKQERQKRRKEEEEARHEERDEYENDDHEKKNKSKQEKFPTNILNELKNLAEESEKEETPISNNLIEYLYAGKLNDLKPKHLYRLIKQSVDQRVIKKTIASIEIGKQKMLEKQILPLFLLFKLLYKISGLIDPKSFLENFTLFISHYLSIKIEFKFICSDKLAAMYIRNPYKIFQQLLFHVNQTKDLEKIGRFIFVINEKTSYLELATAQIKFTIVKADIEESTETEADLATEDYLKVTGN